MQLIVLSLSLRRLDESTSLQRMTRNFEICSAEKQSLQLLVNHLQLQTSALQTQNRELAATADELKFELADLEERQQLQQVVLLFFLYVPVVLTIYCCFCFTVKARRYYEF